MTRRDWRNQVGRSQVVDAQVERLRRGDPVTQQPQRGQLLRASVSFRLELAKRLRIVDAAIERQITPAPCHACIERLEHHLVRSNPVGNAIDQLPPLDVDP